MGTITFETKCYQNDWEYLLKGNRLQKMVEACHHRFDQTILYVNNVEHPRTVARYAEKLVLSGVISSFVHVAEIADEALRFFALDADGFKGGYYYSIAEQVSIYLCKTDYLIHFSSDTIITNEEEWIGSAMGKMEKDARITVANPTWNNKFHRAKEESITEDERFYTSHGFSDQCYLIPTSVFRSPIYNEKNEISESNFPYYGGESF